MSHIDWGKLVNQLVAWVVRPRNIGIFLIKYSSLILIALAGGFSFKAGSIAGVIDAFEFSTGAGLSGNILTVVAWLASSGFLVGIGLVLASSIREWRETDSRRVVVIEMRGLVDTSDKPLINAVPSSIVGRRVPFPVDIRQYVAGEHPNLTEALHEISSIKREVRRTRGDTDRAEVEVVTGGVMQVPLLFYAGTLLDDEGYVHLFDWERAKGEWKQLNAPDDGVRFDISGIDRINGANEVVLAVSATYLADFEGITATFPNMPTVRMTRPDPQVNSLWSEESQAALTQQFLQTLGLLANQGVDMVHLILAAPSSLVLRFGRAYDHRNMPKLRCYQREQGQVPCFPWSVQMAAANQPVSIVNTPITNPAQ